MQELSDISVYIEALQRNLAEAVLERIELRNPFLVRSVAGGASANELPLALRTPRGSCCI